MDIFSHALWAAALAKAANQKLQAPKNPDKTKPKKRINLLWTAFWGIFPDLFAFVLPLSSVLLQIATGKLASSYFFNPQAHHREIFPLFQITGLLYKLSHSFIPFIIVFGVIFLIYRKPVWEMLGWGLHILFDIPTHSIRFYPTPFLWPLSDLRVNGIPWRTPWFMIVNYIAIILVFALLGYLESRLFRNSKQTN